MSEDQLQLTLPDGQADRWKQVIGLGQRLMSLEAGYQAIVSLTATNGPLVDVVSRLFKAKVGLWLSGELWPSYLERSVSENAVRPILLSQAPPSLLMQKALEKGRIYAVCQSEVGVWEETLLNFESVAIPLIDRDGLVLGVLAVSRERGDPFRVEDHEILEALIRQIVMALQSLQRTAIERWRVDQLSLVRQVSLQILNVRDLDELSRRVTSLILDTFHYYFAAIFTLEPGDVDLCFRASAGPAALSDVVLNEDYEEPQHYQDQMVSPPQGKSYSEGLIIRLGEGMIGHVAQTGEEIIANDVSQEPRYRCLDPLPATRSEATLPLMIQDRVVGVLDVQSNLIDDFHQVDLLVLRALAGNIAVAVEGTRLYSSLKRRADHFSAIYEISNAISSVLDPDRLFSEVVHLISKHFGYPYVHLFTVHPGRRKVIFNAGSGSRSEPLEESGYILDLDDPKGIIPWVGRSGETLLVNDVEKESRYQPSPFPPFETRAELTVPLIYGAEILGILDVQSDQVNAFGEEDRFVFESLADNIAVAMRNASLFRSEVWRRQVADSLREVAGLLSADADLSHVLEAILKELVRNLPCDVASIWLLDDEINEDASQENFPPLHLASLSGPLASLLDLAQGLSLERFVQTSTEDRHPLRSPEIDSSAAFLLDALQSKEPMIRISSSQNDPLALALEFPAEYSALAAPLRVGEQSLGVLMLSHHTPGRYGLEAAGITATFSSYAAVSIQNTRLYEAAHEQAWVSTVLLQVAEATQSITNPNDLLSAIAQITPLLVGVVSCAIYTLDDDLVFVPAAVSGLDQERQVVFSQRRFEPGEVKAFEDVLEDRRSSLLRIDVEPSVLAEIFYEEDELEVRHRSSWVVVVPIQGREDLLGAFLVVYCPDPATSGMEHAFEETVSIVQGVSQQLAMAMENVRLLKLQKEEAYISVALLQVAQAVVSNNDLNDILGSIVRITPILVGIRRVAILLWDEVRSCFTLAQAYGIPKVEEEQSFSTGAFPLLDLVLQEDRLLACSLDPASPEETASPRETASPSETVGSWTRFTSPVLSDIDEVLESDSRLLLAFPLSVKGVVFGVFLLEEPDNLPTGGPGASNRRMREKRLEITTGITQQAALAIQNDRFQLDMVRRERLEREMQLAREIQRTFLPHHTPEFKGWELNVYWQPAREVAGDFYDFFTLSDNRLGVLIADVADKGMPAALFMTLVRTVMRATVQQVEMDCAEVLARVNNILVPDSDQGMFVTLFFVVLSLDTGKIAYANAGHNPPLLFRGAEGAVLRLEKGDIALGVIPDSSFTNHTMQLLPGDFLILYTDGITEAFSPLEEMYGEQGLKDTIQLILQRSNGISAEELMCGIDESVQVFVGDSLPADDLTLIVLHKTD